MASHRTLEHKYHPPSSEPRAASKGRRQTKQTLLLKNKSQIRKSHQPLTPFVADKSGSQFPRNSHLQKSRPCPPTPPVVIRRTLPPHRPRRSARIACNVFHAASSVQRRAFAPVVRGRAAAMRCVTPGSGGETLCHPAREGGEAVVGSWDGDWNRRGGCMRLRWRFSVEIGRGPPRGRRRFCST